MAPCECGEILASLMSTGVYGVPSFVAVLNLGLTRPEIEREATRLAKATVLFIRHYCTKKCTKDL